MKIPNKVQFVLARGGLLLKKHSPDILLGAGLVGVVGAAVWAVKETMDHYEEVKSVNEAEMAKKAMDINFRGQTNQITEQQAKQEFGMLLMENAMRWVRLYGPPFALGTASVVSIVAGHQTSKRRAAGVMAAYSLLDRSFKGYRIRVREELGEEKDAMFMYGTPEKAIAEDIDETTGRKKKKKYNKYSCELSEYAVTFDEYNVGWRREAGLNRSHIEAIQNVMNDRLLIKGHVFLNEVYDELNFPRTTAGAVVGWVLDSENGDGVIDLGLYSPINQANRELLDPSIIIDPNVDGVIYDLL